MAFFEGGGGRGSVVRVNPVAPRAAARAAYSPPPPPASSSMAQLTHVMAQARANSGHPEGGAMGQPQAAPRPQSAQVSPVAERILQMIISKLYQGPDQPFALPTTPIGEGKLAGATQSMRQQEVASLFKQDFASLKSQGLIPPSAKEPPIDFPSQGLGGGPRSFEDGGNVHLSPAEVTFATSPDTGAFHSWALEGLIHELAHALQSKQTLGSVPLREGGAQAFADAAVPRVAGPIPTQDTSYSGYVRNVRASKGPQWFMRGQFR